MRCDYPTGDIRSLPRINKKQEVVGTGSGVPYVARCSGLVLRNSFQPLAEETDSVCACNKSDNAKFVAQTKLSKTKFRSQRSLGRHA